MEMSEEKMLEKADVKIKQASAEKPASMPVEKAKQQLKRRLSKETESASYCCEAAFTVKVEELPSEEAFA
jgi:hypothetical protein